MLRTRVPDVMVARTSRRPDRTGPAVAVLAVAVLLVLGAPVGVGAAVQEPGVRIEGVSVEAPRRPTGPERFAEIAELGAEWVAIIPYAFIRSGTGEVEYRSDRRWWGERDEGVRAQVEHARAHGLRVLLKPHVWIRGSGGWAGAWAPETETGWRRFQESYRGYLLSSARLARELDLELLAVGTELSRLVDERPGFFRSLIRDVRDVYDGPLTYAANWDAFARTPFWDQLDYIGVDAYFPLSFDPEASVEELERAWTPVVAELEAFSRERRRPVIFTEFGYRSVRGAAGEQWTLPPERRTDPSLLDEEAQTRAYRALFRSVWDRPWFAGGFLWEWHLAPTDGSRARQARATGFSPRGKRAEAVIRSWYGGGSPTPSSPPEPVDRERRE